MQKMLNLFKKTAIFTDNEVWKKLKEVPNKSWTNVWQLKSSTLLLQILAIAGYYQQFAPQIEGFYLIIHLAQN